MLKLYVPILILFTLAAAFAVVSVFIGPLIGPRRFNKAKSAPYESGIETTAPAQGARLPVKFYLTAMLFIIFDIEIIFLYPWAVAFGQEGGATVFLFVEMLLFIGTVFVAYAYVWRRGGLEWD